MSLVRLLLSASAVKFVSLFGALAFSWLVSFLMPISDAGRLFSVLAIMPGIGVLLGFGIDQTVLKLGARRYIEQGKAGLEAVMGYGARSILIRASVFLLPTLLVVPVLWEQYPHQAEGYIRWSLALVLAPFFAALVPGAMGYRVQSRYVRSIMVEPSGVMSLSAVTLVVLTIFFEPQFWLVYMVYGIFLILLSLPLFRTVFVQRNERIKHDPHFGVTQVAQYFLQWGVVGQISFFATSEDIASISLSMRMVMMINLILILLNTVNGNKISQFIQGGEEKKVSQLLRQQSPILLIVGMMSAVLLGIFSPYFYAFLGESFQIAAKLTWILIFGQLINVLVGPANIMLNMSGNAALVSRITIAIGLPVTFLVWPVYQYAGVVGIAALISVSVSITSLMSAFFATRATGIRPSWPRIL